MPLPAPRAASVRASRPRALLYSTGTGNIISTSPPTLLASVSLSDYKCPGTGCWKAGNKQERVDEQGTVGVYTPHQQQTLETVTVTEDCPGSFVKAGTPS